MVVPNVVYLYVVETDGKGDVTGDNVVKSTIVVEIVEVDEYEDGKRDEGMFVVFSDLSSI